MKIPVNKCFVERQFIQKHGKPDMENIEWKFLLPRDAHS